MNEKRGLTGREKFLVLFAGATLLFYLAVQFGITPAREKLKEKQDALIAAEEARNVMEGKLTTEAAVIKTNEDARKEYEAVAALYPEKMSAEDLVNNVNKLCEGAGLVPVSVQTDPGNWEAYIVEFPNPEEPEEGAEPPEPLPPVRKTATAEDNKTAPLISARVDIRAQGGLAALESLMDTINATSHLRVTGVTLPLSGDGVIPILLEFVMRNTGA